MIDLRALTQASVNSVIAADPKAGCANCQRRKSVDWYFVDVRTIVDGRDESLFGTGICCKRCTGGWTRNVAAYWEHGENVITHVEIRLLPKGN